MTARKTAYKALLRVEKDNAYSNIVLDGILSESELSRRDKAFASMIFYGVMEKKLLLDYGLSRLSDRPVNKLSEELLVILRMGLYQMFFMDSVPRSAAVNESVKLCKANKLYGDSAFANAVLRSAAKLEALQLPDKRKGKNKYLSIKYSCPESLIRLWRGAYGDELTQDILECLEGQPPVSARVNTLKTDRDSLISKLEAEGVDAKPMIFSDDCIVLKNAGSVTELEAFKEGLFHVQDAASQICCRALGAKPGETVIDACSAPGGKSFTIAEMMENRGCIISCDLYENRLRLVESGAQRLGIDIIRTQAGSSSEMQELPVADRILCDVPCSGLGIIRRKPELRYKEDTGADTLPQIQYEILNNCSKFLKSGGTLVYSTCTLNPKENGEVVRRFLAEHSDFSPVKINDLQSVERKNIEPENELTLFPQREGCDGFFISKLCKK